MTFDKISKVFFCPGARNNDLLKMIPPSKISFEVDERIASFKALGFAKATGKIAAVCTTSGTAVAECLPALVEAYYSNVSLILLSADRPLRMRESAAPQTINHEIITRGHRNSYRDLSFDEFKHFSFENIPYPAHINVMIENPNEIISTRGTEKIKNWNDLQIFAQSYKNPLILLSHETQSLRNLAKKLKENSIPFYAELLSSSHELSSFSNENEILKRLNLNHFDSIIRIGHTPLSKAWRLMEKLHLPILNFDSRGMTGLSYGQTMKISIQELTESLEFWKFIQHFSQLSFPSIELKNVTSLLHKYPQSEPSLLYKLQHLLPEGSNLYVGNSLVIRFMELVNNREFKFFGNRGVNGIDGQISTAIGLAQGLNEKVYCVIGDLTGLYDLSSILDLPENLCLIVVNNYGGKIFQTMNLSEQMWMAHNKDFESIAKAFNKRYTKNNFADLFETQILELNPENEQTMNFIKELE